MAFEEIKVQIVDLLNKMTNNPHDEHELEEIVRENLNQLKSTGMPLPKDLIELEEQLEAGFEKRAHSRIVR